LKDLLHPNKIAANRRLWASGVDGCTMDYLQRRALVMADEQSQAGEPTIIVYFN
jgi:hypothetical protein